MNDNSNITLPEGAFYSQTAFL